MKTPLEKYLAKQLPNVKHPDRMKSFRDFIESDIDGEEAFLRSKGEPFYSQCFSDDKHMGYERREPKQILAELQSNPPTDSEWAAISIAFRQWRKRLISTKRQNSGSKGGKAAAKKRAQSKKLKRNAKKPLTRH